MCTISVIINIVTTDVQGVNFTRIDENIYFIQCSYLSGSDVSGCIYVLVSGEEGVENVTGFIERDSNGVTLEMANIGCYSEVLAYDDSIGSLPVRTNISSESCPRPATSGEYLPLNIQHNFDPLTCNNYRYQYFPQRIQGT